MASSPPRGWRQSGAAQIALSMLLLHTHGGLTSSAAVNTQLCSSPCQLAVPQSRAQRPVERDRHPEAEADGTEGIFCMQKKVTSVRSCLLHGSVCWLGLHHCMFNNMKQAGLGPGSFGKEKERNRIKQAVAGTLHSSCQRRQHLQTSC